MTDAAEVVHRIDDAFAGVERPAQLCPCTHGDCEECADQEAFWATIDRTTFVAADLERDAWGTAVTMLRSDGFRWMFPALARAALGDDGAELAEELVTFHLLHRIEPDEPPLAVRAMTGPERAAVRGFVEHVAAAAEELGVEDVLGLLPDAVAAWAAVAPDPGD